MFGLLLPIGKNILAGVRDLRGLRLHDQSRRGACRCGGGGGGGIWDDDWSSMAYAKGGKVTPNRLMGPDPAGPDDGYAALKSGEFVLNEKTAKEIGYEVLKRLNARNR